MADKKGGKLQSMSPVAVADPREGPEEGGGGSGALSAGYLQCFDNTMLCFDNNLLCSDNTVLCFDNSLLCFDNTVLCLEKCLLCLKIWATVDYPASRVSFDLPKRLCSQGTIRSDMARISLFSFWCADYDVEFLQGKKIQNKTTQFQCAPMKHHISRKHFSPLLVQVFHG